MMHNMFKTGPKNRLYSLAAIVMALLLFTCCLGSAYAASVSVSTSSSSRGGMTTTTTTKTVNGAVVEQSTNTVPTGGSAPAPVATPPTDDGIVDDNTDTAAPAAPAAPAVPDNSNIDEDEDDGDDNEGEVDPFAAARARIEERRSRFQNSRRFGNDRDSGNSEDSAPNRGSPVIDLPTMDDDENDTNSTDDATEPEPAPAPVVITEPVPVVPVIEVTGARSALGYHNDFRAKHQVGALSWDSTIEEAAMGWANYLAQDGCRLTHNRDDPYGENLFAGPSDMEEAVQGWYDEVEDYDFNNQGFSGSTGHFTQVVWKGTERLGCAISTCPEGGPSPGRKIYVCQYSPPGNVNNRFEENVFPAVE